MNVKGEYRGIRWIGFARERPGRRRALVAKYAVAPGRWKELTAPAPVTNESKFRAWLRGELDHLR